MIHLEGRDILELISQRPFESFTSNLKFIKIRKLSNDFCTNVLLLK